MSKLRETLEKNKALYVDKLMDLVRIDTHDIGHGILGGLEKEGQEYFISLLKEMGADEIETHPVTEALISESIEKYQEGNPGHNYENRFNVYGTFKGNGGKSILFNSHMDTMPAQKELWRRDPHEPYVENGKMYGLGVCDMKSGLMASTMAVHLLKDAGYDLPGDVLITSVIDEEGGGNGSIAAVMHGIRADAAVVCEPSDNELIAAHMGFVFFEVEVSGIAVHSGTKWNGVNAIHKAMKLVDAIDELEHNWLLTYKHPLLPPPNSNVGVMEGGTAGSTVPDRCIFRTCVHYLPEVMTRDQVIKEYTGAILERCQGDSWLKNHPPKISIYQAGDSFEMDLSHEFVSSFKESFKSVKNEEVKIVGSPSGCDSRLWKNIAKMPTLQYGPGTLAQCHAVDEHIELEQYFDAILVYAELILNWGNNK